jgi:pyruvate,water dikinase
MKGAGTRRPTRRVQVIQALTPPRVLTSDGEAISGVYRRDNLPDGALVV